DDMTVTFTDTYSAETDVDVGQTVDHNQWTVSGEAAVSNDKGQQAAIIGSNQFAHDALQNMGYHEMHEQAGCIFTSSTIDRYYVEPTRDLPGMQLGADRSSGDGPSEYQANSKFSTMTNNPRGSYEKNTGVTSHYGGAVSAYGFTAGAMSKYSNELKIHWDFGA